MQPPHQCPGGAREERERLHRTAGCQREQHPRAKEEQRGRDEQGPDVHHPEQARDPHHQPRQQAAHHRLPHQGGEAFIGTPGEPGAEKRRRDRQNKQNTHHHTAEAQPGAQQYARTGFEYRDPRQATHQHQHVAVKGSVAEEDFVAGEQFGARRFRGPGFRHPARHAEGDDNAQHQQKAVAGAPGPHGIQQAANQRGQQRADQNAHIEQAVGMAQLAAFIQIARQRTRHHSADPCADAL